VIAVARSESKLEAAIRMGAEWTFNGNDEKLVDRVLDVTHGKGADVVIDLVGSQATFQAAFNSLKKGGTIVMVAASIPEISFPVGQVMFKEVTIKGAIGMKKQTMIDAIDLCLSEKIKPYITDRFPLEKINEAAQRMKESKITGRLVLIP
jgi:propanol-preferring alcohol dehydrogenase